VICEYRRIDPAFAIVRHDSVTRGESGAKEPERVGETREPHTT